MRLVYSLLLLFLSLKIIAQPAPSLDVNSFVKPVVNPVLKADSSFVFTDPISRKKVKWQKADVFNPAAIVKDGYIYLLYRCEDNPKAILGGRTSRLGLAKSSDGIHFKKFPRPVLYPANDSFKKYDYPGGCEDPRLVQTTEGLYVITYTSWNYKTPRLSIAFSKDLLKWEKKGPAFLKAYNGRFADMATKSGSIITKMERGRPVAARMNGKYWMYWGEHFVNLAWSENLYDWTPLLDDKNELLAVIKTRPNKFDSELTECGPPALITDKGIVLLYNGKNATDEKADPQLPKGTYATGQVIFDVNDPTRVIERADTCFLKPTLKHEMTGQYQSGTTFTEALVLFKGKWFLYYGTADSFVGVAIAE